MPSILLLSDRGVDAANKAIPALLAMSAVHQRLVRDGIRMYTGLWQALHSSGEK